MDNFIEIYEKSLPDEICDLIISYFTTHKEFAQPGATLSAGISVDPGKKDSTDMNLLSFKDDISPEIWRALAECIREGMANYVLKYPILGGTKAMKIYRDQDKEKARTELWNGFSVYPFTALAKKYEKCKQGYHMMHCDQGHNFPHIYRQSVCMFYLNDVHEGGETEFMHQKLKVKPQKGSLVIFPAFYTHIHKGCIPRSNDKYILNFWIIAGFLKQSYLEKDGKNYFVIKPNGHI